MKALKNHKFIALKRLLAHYSITQHVAMRTHQLLSSLPQIILACYQTAERGVNSFISTRFPLKRLHISKKKFYPRKQQKIYDIKSHDAMLIALVF